VTLHIYESTLELGAAAATLIAETSAGAIQQRGRFMVALSGGSLPGLIAPALLAEPLRRRLDWAAWHVFFADERCVPLDHPDSNYRLACQRLFDHLPIPPAQIHPLAAPFSAVEAAKAYRFVLKAVFGKANPPQFDLILLGMGPDGHTASLFPGHPLLSERKAWVAPILDAPKPPPERITLTLPVLNAARVVAFIATGAGKAEVLPQVLRPGSTLPAGLVQPTSGHLHWLVDTAAAKNMPVV
jgi:6-phosphogluconolactonase